MFVFEQTKVTNLTYTIGDQVGSYFFKKIFVPRKNESFSVLWFLVIFADPNISYRYRSIENF